MHQDILFELGIVLTLGFLTAVIMKKMHQSVITGYMVAGLLIGPNVLGLIKDPGLINTLSELGIVFLMFFLGLEFSIGKFLRVKNSVLFIGTYKILFNFILGLLLGGVFGFIFKESIFLAGIIALSSSGVVAKLLFDMKRTASYESEILMGVMVYEDFIAIVILGILSGIGYSNSLQVHAIIASVGKSIAFYAIFIASGVFLMNKFIDRILLRIESQELFTALMMGLILLLGSFAVKIGLASAAGAFLLGMLINSYDVEERLHRTVSAFKDIFLIVFFISFGMLLNPKQIPGVLSIACLLIPLSLAAEVIFTSSAAFLTGLKPKSAAIIGSSTVARGEYSMIYAAMGYSLGLISTNLYQLTGVYVFGMTLLAPLVMRNSDVIRKIVSAVMPRFTKYSAKLVSITLRPILLPEESGLPMQRKYTFIGLFLAYITVTVIAFFQEKVAILLPLSIAGLGMTLALRKLFMEKVKKAEGFFKYEEIHSGFFDLDNIARVIGDIFSGFLTIVVLGAAFWNFGPYILIGLLMLFTAFVSGVSFQAYRISQGKKK